MAENTHSVEVPEIITEREKTHGLWWRTAAASQALKQVVVLYGDDLTARQTEVLEMICVKMARIMCGDASFDDHWDDIMGYAELGKEKTPPTKG